LEQENIILCQELEEKNSEAKAIYLKCGDEIEKLERKLRECREVLREVIEALDEYEAEKENLNFGTVMRIGSAMEQARRLVDPEG
jgi:chromosome segregation ATPase